MKKRIIMIALMLVMVMSSFSVPVFADDEYSDPDAYIKDSIKSLMKNYVISINDALNYYGMQVLI